ncbi:SCO family protein [Telmatobacter bradus]|uniref:SCO family protein n=1 Tax=Telmatobacter bradus TaxID=474953 RepID=UPI003B433C87
MFSRRHVACAAVLSCVALSVQIGCRKSADSEPGVALHPANTAVDRYHLRGLVLATSPATGQITVQHGDIPGFMPAMTMAYKLKDPKGIQNLKPGDEITADVLVHSDRDDYLLDSITITSEARRGLLPAMLPPHQLMVGETVPDLPLVNEDGKTIHLNDYRGKALLVTFIYTRCPMPTACPLISSKFARVNNALETDPKAYAASHLISISLDPAYDTPPVLRQYGLAYLDDNPSEFTHWEFADTTPDDLKKLAQAFGLEYSEENNQITHTMATTLISPDSKVEQTWAGSDWKPDDVADAVKAAALRTRR